MASEWKVGAGEPGGCQTLADSAWRPWPWLFTGDKEEKVVTPRAGFNPKPAVGLSPQAAVGEQEKYDKSFKAEEKKALEMKMSY